MPNFIYSVAKWTVLIFYAVPLALVLSGWQKFSKALFKPSQKPPPLFEVTEEDLEIEFPPIPEEPEVEELPDSVRAYTAEVNKTDIIQ